MRLTILTLIFLIRVDTIPRASASCGNRRSVTGTIFGGVEVKRNAWPWLVAFFNRKKEKYFCAGSLISEKHVLSAAHCFQDKGHLNPIPPEFVKAFMGKYDLNISDEIGSKSSLIWKIILHPDWKWNEEKFDADISVLVLMNGVEFSRQIQPVCLPEPSYEEVRGNGFVVGWGKSENTGYSHGYESRLNQLLIPAVNSSHCYTTFYILGSFSSNRAFCGGYENKGRAPCLGDSGVYEGGFYMKDEHWNIKGIVSAAIVDFDRGCDINKFSIYTNVARFTEWINKTMKTTKEIKWNDVVFKCVKNDDVLFTFTESVDADCFHSFEGPFTRSLQIETNFTSHSTIKYPDDVKSLVIYFGASSCIFNGLGKAFKNLELLYIPDNALMMLERSNFYNMTKLKRLELYDKKIEFVAEDSFWDLPNLEILSLFKCGIDELPKQILYNMRKLKKFVADFNRITNVHADFFAHNLEIEEIHFRNNQLKVIEEDFIKLSKLKSLRLQHNDCIDASFIVTNPDTISLKELQSIIDDNCKTNNRPELKESWWKNDR